MTDRRAPPDPGSDGEPPPAPEPVTADPELRSHLGAAFGQVMEALETDPDELEDLSARLFGSAPEQGFEEATVEHARRAHEAGMTEPVPAVEGGAPIRLPGDGGRLEHFVRLTFKRSKGEADAADLRQLAVLEQELGATGREDDEPLLPEVDASEFVREWRRANPDAARPDPALTESGEISIDPLAREADDDTEADT